MDNPREWVDANSPPDGRRFSARRAAKLLVAILVLAFLGTWKDALLEGGLEFMGLAKERAAQQRQDKQRLDAFTHDLEKAAREGQAGDKTMRLFGIDPKKKKPMPEAPEPGARSCE